MPPAPTRTPLPSDIPLVVWAVLGSILIVGIVEVVIHLVMLPSPPTRPAIRPNAPLVPPLSAEAQRLSSYGPTPVRLAGIANYYVIPAAKFTVLWRYDEERKAYFPASQLPPFSSVQALRQDRQTGLVEIRINDTANGYIEPGRLAPGDATAAHAAYCAYNAGPAPGNGEIFRLAEKGNGRLELDNRTTQPAVVKLRNASGVVALTTYLAPSAHASIEGLPEGRYRPEFAIGELWSRACQSFAAGMRAQRLTGFFTLDALTPLAIPPDLPGEPPPVDIADQTFERDQ